MLRKDKTMTQTASVNPSDGVEQIMAGEEEIFALPASYAQKRLWLLEQWSPGEFNIGIIVGMAGHLNKSLLEKAIQTIIQRHEVLRTVFSMEGDELKQIVLPHMPFALDSIDLSSFQLDVRRSKIRRITEEEFQRPFNLEKGPLIRATILEITDRWRIFILTIHHIISDGWSMEVLYREMNTLYAAYHAGQPSPLPDLTVQYADYTVWQNNWLQSWEATAEIDFWKKRLSQVSPLDLPIDHPRSSARIQAANLYFALPHALSDALKTLSRKEGATLFMTLLTAWKVLFYRYTGRPDITVGTIIAGRVDSDLENLIGCFITTLALHTDLSGNPSFRQLLKSVCHTTLEAYDHQTLPFERITEEISLGREINISPLTQLLFSMQNVPREPIHLPELVLTPIEMDAETLLVESGNQPVQRTGMANRTQVADLDLRMWEKDGCLVGEIEYNAGLFEPATISQIQTHLQHILEEMVACPDQRIDAFSLLLQEEEHQILNIWNDTYMPVPSQCFPQLFEEQVALMPTAPAVVQGDEQLSYDELNQRANRLAWHLRSLGVGPGSIVALLTQRSIDFLVAILGVFKAGGAYLPLDPAYPLARLNEIITLSGSRLLLATSDCQLLCLSLAQNGREIIQLEELSRHTPGEIWENPPASATPRDLAYVIYTSGSTGKPKGVMIEHQGMLNHLYAKIEALGLTENDILAQTASQCFDISIWQFLAALLVGGRVQIYPDDIAHHPALLLTSVGEDGITTLELVPSLLNACLNTSELPPLKHLRWLLSTGEALPASLCQRWLACYPSIPLVNAYGPTECSDDVTHYPIYEAPDSTQNIPIGMPIANTRLYVLDQQLTPLPVGVKGEICVGGRGVGRGYLHDPQQTAEVFVPDPFSTEPGARLYKTGDLGCWLADGTLEYLGRIDHQVKVRGYRIELGEIEAVLRAHPAVQECVVLAREDIPGNQQLVAYLVAKPPQKLVIEELRFLLKEAFPEYMHPTILIELEAFPLTANGKLDRRALPMPASFLSEQEYVAPRTEVERQLAEIWCHILERERVGIYDDFFTIGGQSLLLINLMVQIEKRFARNLPLTTLFRHRTIADLAELLSRQLDVDTETHSATLQIDLSAEVQLPLEVCPEIWPGDISVEPATVFLTGATGFLGTFLLADLLQQTCARIYCLVRASSLAEGWQRIKESLALALSWQEEYEVRIKPVLGDLTMPRLGLSEEAFDALAGDIESIYHSGAQVNALYPYAELKAANVLGTQEVIRLAAQRKVKPLHYVSTLSVFAHRGPEQVPLVREQDSIDEYSSHLPDGYTQSKWVAEKLVRIARSRGLPVAIYRPGRLTGHSQTGAWRADDIFGRVIRGCILLGAAPILLPIEMQEMTPVDYVSQAIVALARQKISLGQAFHLYNPVRVSIPELVAWINEFGYPLQHIPYSLWQRRLVQEAENNPGNPLVPLLPLFPAVDTEKMRPGGQEPVIFDTTNVQVGLAGTSITCPPACSELFFTYLKALRESGSLPPQP